MEGGMLFVLSCLVMLAVHGFPELFWVVCVVGDDHFQVMLSVSDFILGWMLHWDWICFSLRCHLHRLLAHSPSVASFVVV